MCRCRRSARPPENRPDPMNTRRYLTTALLTLLACAAAAAAPRLADDAVVARVGSEAITKKALTAHLLKYVGRTALSDLVDRSAIEQEAGLYKIIVTDADLEKRAAEAKTAAGDRFKEGLEREGISEEVWRLRLRRGMMVEKIAEKKWPI